MSRGVPPGSYLLLFGLLEELAAELFSGSRGPTLEAGSAADLRVVDGAGVRHVVVAGEVVVRERELAGEVRVLRVVGPNERTKRTI